MASAYRPAGRHVYKITFKDHRGDPVTRASGLRDRRAAEELAAKVERDAELLRVGKEPLHPEITAPFLGLAAAERPDWAQALAAYLGELSRRNDEAGPESRNHRDQRTKLARVARECGWARPDQIEPGAFGDFLARLARSGRAPRTQNFYLSALRSFAGYCRRRGWLRGDPLAEVGSARVGAAGRRRLRRAFEHHELEALCAAATPGRAMVYRVAAYSGFRRSELLRLRKEDCAPAGPRPRWQVDGSRTKNGLPARLPMAPNCAEALLAHWLALPAGAPLFPRGHDRAERRTASGVPTHRSLRRDLRAAGLARQDERGRWLDFHSLRFTFCLLLHRAGYGIEVVSRYMRHWSVQLTDATYLELGLDRRGAGEHALPDLRPGGVTPAGTPGGDEPPEILGKIA